MKNSEESSEELAKRLRPPGSIPLARTTFIVAAELGVPVSRVRHILATRPYIRPAARAGRTLIWSKEAVAQIRHELNAIDARKASRDSGDLGLDLGLDSGSKEHGGASDE